MRNILVAAFLLLAGGAFAQSTVRGFVKDKKNGKAVPFSNVVLVGTQYGATTDIDGYYAISKIPKGDYTVSVTNVLYKTYTESISFTSSAVKQRTFYLEGKVEELGTAEITAERSDQLTKPNVSVEVITPKQINQLPSIGGQADLAQFLQVVPGVVFTGDQGGQLYIRGGSPVQNKVLLDGMTIYSPFHSIGLFSVFDTDLIRSADVYTGGFSAKFGGRISSVMDITTITGDKTKTHGRIGASPFGVKGTLEGPIKKYDIAKGGGSISYILSYKKSYLEQSSKVLYDYIDQDGLPFNFSDLYGKVTFASGNGSKFNVFGFNFTDDVRYQAISDLNWKNRGAGANFLLLPSGSPVLINGNFSVSNYDIQIDEEAGLAGEIDTRASGINSFNFGLSFKHIIDKDEISFGLEGTGFSANYNSFTDAGLKIQIEDQNTEFGGFFLYKIIRDRLILEPSIRIQRYASLSVNSFEPRLGAKFKASERLRLKFAGGRYTQNLISTNSDLDVVNLFYGYLAAPENIPSQFTQRNGERVDLDGKTLQVAWHGVTGFEFDVTEKINLNVEGYYKGYPQVTNINRNKVFEDTVENANEVGEEFTKDFIVESGRAYGVDIVTKYADKRNYVWLVYSLGKVTRWTGFEEYAPVFDRRHNVNFVTSRKLGKDMSWEVSVRWNLGSGFPFTQVQGYFQEVDFNQGLGTGVVNSNSNELGIKFAELNKGRLPFYHRMDVSAKKTIKLRDGMKLEANASITNLYSRENVFYINRITSERVNQLPFMPAIGVDFIF